ncbi:hypothetical protein [Streptomyces lincolnensis]|uniref:hypothetical protein n=1 Tax=Streptomyces lincolnensis TaxID=1915 RepID=UPI0037D06107
MSTPPAPQGPYGWGGLPPMAPPPPKKSRVGLILGIVGGAVVAVVGVLALIGSTVARSTLPAAEFSLTLPQTLLDGRFELAEDLSDSQGAAMEKEAEGAWDAKVTEAVVGQYSLNGDPAKGVLVLSGMYGRFRNADHMSRGMLKGAADADGVTVTEGPRGFPQEGSPTVYCEVLTQEQAGTTTTYPLCAWTDDNTSATVVPAVTTAAQDPAAMPLAAYARMTLQIRSEARKPLA